MDTQREKNPRRVAAGRRNGLLAKGCKTAEGRARSAMNSARHNLASHQFLVLPMEDSEAFQQLSRDLESTLAPQDAHEQTLVYTIITSQWRLLRIDDLERIARSLETEKLLATPGALPQSKDIWPSEAAYWLAFERCEQNPAYKALNRYRLQYQRAIARATKELLDYRKAPKPPIADYTDLDPAISESPIATAPAPAKPSNNNPLSQNEGNHPRKL